MKQTRTLHKAMSILLTAAMLLNMGPFSALAQDVTLDANYVRTTPGIPAAAKRAIDNKAYQNAYAIDNGAMDYDINTIPTKYDGVDMKLFKTDSLRNSVLFHADNKSYANATYEIRSKKDGDLSAQDAGDIAFRYGATFKNDKHLNTKQHPTESKVSGFDMLINNFNRIDSDSYKSDTTVKLEGYTVLSRPNATYTYPLTIRATGDCTCGGSKLSKAYLIPIDNGGPELKGISFVKAADDAHSSGYFKAGEKMFIRLKYSEAIRFSDDITHNNVSLDLKLTNATTGVEINTPATARLRELSGDTLLFEYNFPTNLENPVIVSLKGEKAALKSFYSQDIFNFDLVHYGINGEKLEITPAMIDENPSQPLNKSNSLIVDLAGNPMTIKRFPSAVATFDCTGPKVKATGLNVIKSTDNMTNNFVGTDDRLEFSVIFDEQIILLDGSGKDASPTALKATLNANDAAGKPVMLTATSITTRSDGINASTPLGVATFSTAMDGIVSTENLCVTSISLGSGYTLGDKAHNYLLGGDKLTEKITVKPDKELYIDNTPPTVTLGAAESYSSEGVGNAFYLPLQISDGERAAGTNGVRGSFKLEHSGAVAHPLEYLITNTTDQPESGQYSTTDTKKDTSYMQVDGKLYLHLRIPEQAKVAEAAEYKLTIAATDLRGNKASLEQSLDGVRLDNIAPVIKLTLSEKTFDADGATINAVITVSDNALGENPITALKLLGDGDAKDIGGTGAATNGVYSYTLDPIKVTGAQIYQLQLSAEAEDNAGNKATATLALPAIDLTKPQNETTIKTNLQEIAGSHDITITVKDGNMAWIVAPLTDNHECTADHGEATHMGRFIDASGDNATADLTETAAGGKIWRLIKLTEDGNGYTVEDLSVNTSSCPHEYSGINTYGNVNLTVYTYRGGETIAQLTEEIPITPPANEAATTPPVGDKQTPPTSGDGQTPPTSGDGQTLPTSGDKQTPPTSGDGQTPPTSGDGQTLPTSGDGQTPPTSGDGQTPPPVEKELLALTASKTYIPTAESLLLEEHYTLQQAYIRSNQLHTVGKDIAVKLTEYNQDREALSWLTNGYNSSPAAVVAAVPVGAVQSTEGLMLGVGIENLKVPDYGLYDFAFGDGDNKASLSFHRVYYSNEEPTSEFIKEFIDNANRSHTALWEQGGFTASHKVEYAVALQAIGEQTITLPALPTGKYVVELKLPYKNVAGKAQYFYLPGSIQVNNGKITTSGENAKLEQKYTTSVNTVPNLDSSPNGVTPDKEVIINQQSGSSLKVSIATALDEIITEKTAKLTLKANATLKPGYGAPVPPLYARVWNKSADDAGNYQWHLMTLENNNSCITEYDIVTGTPDYTKRQLALNAGMNEIGCSFMAENGAITESTIFIDASDALTDVKVETQFSPTDGKEKTYYNTIYSITQNMLDSRNGHNFSVTSDRPASYLLLSDAYNFLPNKTAAESDSAAEYAIKQDILAENKGSQERLDGYYYWENLRTRMKSGKTPKLLRNGDYYMTAMDAYGGLGVEKFTVDNIDNRAPRAAEIKADTGSYVITATGVEAETDMILQGNDSTMVLNASTINSITTGGKHGIYTAAITENENDSSLFDYHVVGYGTSENSFSPSVSMRDKYNNEANTQQVYLDDDFSVTCTSMQYKEDADSVVASFSQPVIMTCLGQEKKGYQTEFRDLPIFTGGDQTITFIDLHGKAHTQTLKNLEIGDPAFRCAVDISELSPTKNDVTVTVNAMLNDRLTIDSITADNGSIVYVKQSGKNKIATVTMTDNGSISYTLASGDKTINRTIKIDNIDRKAPIGTTSFSYAEPLVDGRTKGEIYTTLLADEEIEWLSDGAVHIFSYGNSSDHTFRYRDLAGNEGNTTVKCPAIIDEKPPILNDTTPPAFTFAVNRITNGVRHSVGSFGADFNAEELPPFNGALELVFDITDESKVTVQCPGAGVSGSTVRIESNGSFTVKLTDAAGNSTSVPLKVTAFDNSPPTGELAYEDISGDVYGVRAVLTVKEENVKILNGTGVSTLADENVSKYYHDFAKNESFTFTLQDTAGNIGNVVATCTTLDFNPPSSRSLWTPGREPELDAGGGIIQNKPIVTKTNSDVKLFLKFSKPVKNVTLKTDIDGTTAYNGDKVKLTANSNDAVLTFTDNDSVWLHYTGTNNISAAQEFKVGMIDKAPAAVTYTTAVAPNKSYEEVTFTVDKTVTFVDGTQNQSGKLPSGTIFTKKFTQNGDYLMRFVDEAGNTASQSITITSIDRTAPKLTIKGKPLTLSVMSSATPAEKAEYEAINGNGSFKRVVTNMAITMMVQMDEAGTILWGGKEYPVTANTAQEISVENNGAYNLVARDAAGLTTTSRIFVDNIDKVAPVARFSHNELSFPLGTGLTEVQAAVIANLCCSDNVTATEALNVVYTLPGESDLNIHGNYKVSATITDEAGNSTTVDCSLYIYPKDRPSLLINGTFVKEGETAFISEKQLTVTVENLASGSNGTEPYKLYCKKGINTIGQMKDAPIASDDIPLDTDSFYTVYLMTQSRKEVIVYVYVQY